MWPLKLIAVFFVSTDATKSLREAVKQHTNTNIDQWIIPKSGENTVVSQRQLSNRFSATSIINLLNGIAQILSRNQSNFASSSQDIRQSRMKLSNPTNVYSQKRHQPLTRLDTGGSNFDRFIVSERRNDNPMLDWIIGKFSRRGLDWSSGNLRLVNVQGNSILGTDLIVHDRSIEIPLKRWLYILHSVLAQSSNY